MTIRKGAFPYTEQVKGVIEVSADDPLDFTTIRKRAGVDVSKCPAELGLMQDGGCIGTYGEPPGVRAPMASYSCSGNGSDVCIGCNGNTGESWIGRASVKKVVRKKS